MMEIKKFDHPVYQKLADYKVILCSTSPRRKDILAQLGFQFEIAESHFEENLDKSKYSVDEYVRETATGKAKAVWNSLDRRTKTGKILLIAGDTVVESGGKIYEKPQDYQKNVVMLKELRDSKNAVNVRSGVVLLLGDEKLPDGYQMVRFNDKTVVEMKNDVSDEFIELYCRTGEGLQVAGGFRIQGYGIMMMKGVKGDFYNGVGLPSTKTFDEICKLLGCVV